MPMFRASLANLHFGRATRVTASIALAGMVGLTAVEAGATGVSGAIGPVGPIGPSGRVGPTIPGDTSSVQDQLPRNAAANALAEHAPRDRAATAPSEPAGNRIEVTGNTATNVRSDCAGGTASVNQVDVDGRALRGRTVIIQGRNVENVQVPCDAQRSDQPGAPTTQINSVRIR